MTEKVLIWDLSSVGCKLSDPGVRRDDGVGQDLDKLDQQSVVGDGVVLPER